MSIKEYTVEITVTYGGTRSVSAFSADEAEELALFDFDEIKEGKVVERFAYAQELPSP